MHEISKRSWHYRLYRYIGNVPNGPRYLNPFAKLEREERTLPKSLCPYAWSILLGLIGVAVIGLLLIAISPLLLVVLLGVLAWRVLGRLISLAWRQLVRAFEGAERMVDRVLSRQGKSKKPVRQPEPKAASQPSLVASYLKARKQKACPPIKLVD